jgi:hypothetical protein
VKGEFKLADPGFAHFVKKENEMPMGEIIGGTETYGGFLQSIFLDLHNGR